MVTDGAAISIRPVTPQDLDAWVRLRAALWPEGSEAEHRDEARQLLANPPGSSAVLVAEGQTGLVGFAEVSIRAYAEGCRSEGVGYLEGWFVVPEARKQGVGRRLVAAAEDWARTKGCSEFASDAVADNESSAVAHRALGFTDVGLVRCFRKDL
jgi:aminoglycoside 6'-N-acetyltransferase I